MSDWSYDIPPENGDARKLVTLDDNGMRWVGIRAFHRQLGCWINNNEPETHEVVCWQELPAPDNQKWTVTIWKPQP